MTILVLGATGLLGNTVFRALSESKELSTLGTIRNQDLKEEFIPNLRDNLIHVENLQNESTLDALFREIQPTTIINCTSLDRDSFQDHIKLIKMFSILPRKLAFLSQKYNTRLIHIGTDAVFSGKRGGYTEEDFTDAEDMYGISKLLGEPKEPNVITLRTSMIGPSLSSRSGLLDWFLNQKTKCKGYSKAIFSGLPTITLAQIIRDIIIPSTNLQGVYHLSAKPISKFDLLKLIAQSYDKNIIIEPDDTFVLDRSLSTEKFKRTTGYVPAEWAELIDEMRSYTFGLKEI
jgi:dTDP-4-dehydrorhamnose reductase